jgi:hypothetical protein
MSTYKVYKETTLPGSLQANSIYLIAPAAHPSYLEIYVTNSAGDASRRTHRVEDIQAMIDASMSGSGNAVAIVDDIAARDGLTPANGDTALVVDASADAAVTAGAATYIYRSSNTTWIKISEAESMDVALTWAALTDKPTSTVTQIDTAVTNSHTHANKTELDQIGEDGNGDLTYNGSNIAPRLTTAGW